MGSKVDIKKWIYVSGAVFVALCIMEFILMRWVLAAGYPNESPSSADIRDSSLLRVYIYLGRAIFSLLFSYMFIRGYEGKAGLGEGARFGLWVGLMIHVPAFFYNLVVTESSLGLLLTRAAGNVIETVLLGILANMVYAMKAKHQKT